MKSAQAQFIIKGLVQGVFYRVHAKEEAEKLGLTGEIKNVQDGSVEAILQGDESALLKFKEWAEAGSPDAIVERVEMDWKHTDAKFHDVKIF